MSDAFIGIESSNEFFTQHYLAAILKNDLKDQLKTWRERAAALGENARTPPHALEQLHREFFEYHEALRIKHKQPEARVEAHSAMYSALLTTLGYQPKPRFVDLGKELGHLPLLAEVTRSTGAPRLWVVPVVATHEERDDERDDGEVDETPAADTSRDTPTLARSLLLEQYPRDSRASDDAPQKQAKSKRASKRSSASTGAKSEPKPSALEDELRPATASVEELVTAVFNREEPPRFVILCGETELILAERVKWAEQRLLSFDLVEILGRREGDTLDITAALLHRDCLVPDDGAPLLDTLDDNSHKHAFEVSEDLKYALQASIERLGNAAISQLREKQREKKIKMAGADDAEQLARECLRYMYRLLFLFYIEARPELGYAPMGADAYRLGYSLERLRELEQLDLQTDEARRGTYIHECLKRLFALIHDGTPTREQTELITDHEGELATSHIHTFELSPLRSHLFDPQRTPLLAQVEFPNEVLRDVIEWMSLTRAGKKKGRTKARRRGRISYATLGINQLGAVYEALLSFRGFFAEHDLYEVKPAKEKHHDVLKTAYFVPEADLDQYNENERVYEGKALKRYPKGTFIYRLAGRDRQTSASYYTPEVLTRCLVKYALKELLEDETGALKKTADEILDLTICEPAMGSAAFLNEAVNQLAEAYLKAKQKELNDRIPHDRYTFEKQRVKMYIADNNVYGVDLNPVAVELAEVSLWLNTIHEGGFVPWFGGQTVCGNSLIGARRQVFSKKELDPGKGKKKQSKWLDAVPERVPLGSKRPKGSAYHFLLGDRGMSVYGQGNEGKPIREMAKDQLKKIDAWRKEFCGPIDKDDREAMVELSDAIDRLWNKHVDLLRRIRARTSDPLAVYGRPLKKGTRSPTTTAEKDAIWEKELFSKQVRAASPYRRLKLVMDYWCALWFWPIEKADLLPDRDEYLADLSLLLDTDVLTTLAGGAQKDLFAPTMPADEAQALADELGVVDVDAVVARNERLQLVRRLRDQNRFLHWELEFADVFTTAGGFDLVLGNPPWVRIEWSEKDVLSDVDPAFVLRKLSTAVAATRRLRTLRTHGCEDHYLTSHENASGVQAFLSAIQNYPDLTGVKVNLYKCFLPLAWSITNRSGATALLHPEGLYDDPKGGQLRQNVYRRLRHHYQFINELILFDIGHGKKYSINVLGNPRSSLGFINISNLFTPSTIDSSHSHTGIGSTPGMRDQQGWCTMGHRSRMIRISRRELALFSRLYDRPGTPETQARLPALHSSNLIPALESFAQHRITLGQTPDWTPSFHLNETYAQKENLIKKRTFFAKQPSQLILSGPHFSVSTPLYKTPRSVCRNNSHYDTIDLCNIPNDYLPRTTLTPVCKPETLAKKTTRVSWEDQRRPITNFYRLVVKRALDAKTERTLQPSICPPGVGHIDGVYSYTFKQLRTMIATVATWSSIPVDFFVKTTGASDCRPNLASQLPVIDDNYACLGVRALRLNCISLYYSDLWSTSFDSRFTTERWSKSDQRLDDDSFSILKPVWTNESPLRADYARRQALVELDVLISISLGLTLDQLKTMYRVQFYVLRQNEADTWYDRNGRIIFTCSKGLTGVGLPRKKIKGDPTPAWEDVKDMKSGTVERTIMDDTLPGGPHKRTIVYQAPFDRCDREKDYEVAWKHFEERFANEKAAAGDAAN